MNRLIAGVLRFGPLPAVVAGQTVLLAWLGVVLDREVWPADNPVVLVPFVTVVFGWPILVLFAAEPGSFKRTAAFAGACAVVAVLLGAYVGWQATPEGKFSVDNLYSIYVATQLGAGFIALAFMQQFAARVPFRYAALFKSAWRNLLVAALSLALVGGVAILLALWAALFAILGIDALAETFTEPWFALPAAGLVFGVGTMLFRRRDGLIDGIVGLVESLGRYLLPVVLLIVAVFLVTLPFVSVGALWDTGLGSRILIALGAIAVLLIGIAYRPDADLRYPGSVQLAITSVVVVLPILPALAVAGILIRVNQYGWTVSRCWAFVFAGVLALFSSGYLCGVIRNLAEWPRVISAVNVSMACLVLAVLLLQNTPVLDFRAISARSQLARVESGKTGPSSSTSSTRCATWRAPDTWRRSNSLRNSASTPSANGGHRIRGRRRHGYTAVGRGGFAKVGCRAARTGHLGRDELPARTFRRAGRRARGARRGSVAAIAHGTSDDRGRRSRWRSGIWRIPAARHEQA